MVKRTITITTILLILAMVVSLIIVLNKSSFAADDDIASGTSGTCSWVIDANGMMTIRPTNGVSGTLENHPSGYNYNIFSRYQNDITKIVIMPGVKTNSQCNWLLGSLPNCTEMDLHNLDVSGSYNLNSMFRQCNKLEKINVTGWNVTNAKDVSYMFANCHALKDIIGIETWQLQNVTNTDGLFSSCIVLESVDISNFNMHNVTNARLMFNFCTKLKSITIGENFNFICNISNEENLVTFPTYASKWVRSDREYGPYTPVELRENYTPEMAGTWVWEKEIKYNVKYSYIGKVPNGASELPAEGTYKQGDEVTVAPNASAPGYTFSGWSRTGSFEMPGENIEITGGFTARTDTPYKVEHYLEDLNSDNFTLIKTDNLTGETDTEVSADAKDYEGFTFDSSISGTKLSGNIAGDGSLVLKLYYKRNSYNVTYSYTGDIPGDASALPQQETYEYEEEIIVPEEATADGYTFSGWIKDYINMPAKDIEITGYFIENQKSYRYKVEYFFDGELDDTLDEILNAEKDEEISITPQTPLKHGEKNYTLVSDNHKITISINDEDNIIKVYYETDVLDYAIDNFEDESAGDGISDKYQIRITYKVENGSWNDGTNNNKINVITLYDKEGNPSEEGSGNTKIPEVGSKPNEGYEEGSWNKEFPREVSKTNDGDEFIYSYKIAEVIDDSGKEETSGQEKPKTDISQNEAKIFNPKTDDVMNRYLLSGIGGILVLMLVSRIRRKYSRKAKKIQF